MYTQIYITAIGVSAVQAPLLFTIFPIQKLWRLQKFLAQYPIFTPVNINTCVHSCRICFFNQISFDVSIQLQA